MRCVLTLLAWVVGLELLGSLSGVMTEGGLQAWYQALNKSALTPPDIVFPIVWGVLYAMIGVVGWLIWSAPKENVASGVKALFVLQLLLNLLWTPLFFHFHFVGLALMDVGVIFILAVCLVARLISTQRMAAVLLMPYALWLLFAAYLNAYIWLA